MLWLWQQSERGYVPWPDDAEVAVVQGGHCGEVEPFGEGDHGRVDRSEWQIGVGGDEISDCGRDQRMRTRAG